MSERRFEYVNEWHAEQGRGLVINGEVFPYAVAAEGPMVERLEGAPDGPHLLWLPLLAEGPCPTYGRPDGELATPDGGER